MIRLTFVLIALSLALGCKAENKEAPAPEKPAGEIAAPAEAPPAADKKKGLTPPKINLPNAADLKSQFKERNENAGEKLENKKPPSLDTAPADTPETETAPDSKAEPTP